ncbi:MAG TPA: phosphoribosylanthranilate isomerase [Parasegetibacter sp.]
MTRPEQLIKVDELGISFAGLIFYQPSPRYVLNRISPGVIKELTLTNTRKVGVFVNDPVEILLKTADKCGLDMVQLHGDESPEYCADISEHFPVIKVFRLTENERVQNMIDPYVDTVDFFMFDRNGTGYGGTGKKFNWELLNQADLNTPYFLSGGITPEDVAAVRWFKSLLPAENLYAIDMNSGFEISPGYKNMELVAQFVNEIKNNKSN